MIVTITPNAAIDKTLTVPNFQIGFRHRASQSLTLPGGKGVNVARVLKTIGQPVVTTGLVGGRTGQQIIEARHLLTAVIMTAPGTLMMAKMFVPETGHPKTMGTVSLEVESPTAMSLVFVESPNEDCKRDLVATTRIFDTPTEIALEGAIAVDVTYDLSQDYQYSLELK